MRVLQAHATQSSINSRTTNRQIFLFFFPAQRPHYSFPVTPPPTPPTLGSHLIGTAVWPDSRGRQQLIIPHPDGRQQTHTTQTHTHTHTHTPNSPWTAESATTLASKRARERDKERESAPTRARLNIKQRRERRKRCNASIKPQTYMLQLFRRN